jgi:predicted metal-binding protein
VDPEREELWIGPARELGVEARVLAPGQVVTAEWVRMKCRYGCPDYGTNLLCPPFTPTPAETRRLLDEYAATLLLRLDCASGADSQEQSRRLSGIAIALERRLFFDGFYKAFALTAGGYCSLCESCVLHGVHELSGPYDVARAHDVDGAHDVARARAAGVVCRYPERARPPVTASGIDIFATSANAGWPLDVVAGTDAPYRLFALVLVE